MLHNLLNDRFLATKYKIEKIIIEENLTKIKKSDLSEMIYELRNPYFELLFENKSCTMLSIIDFSLGYFRRYCAKKLDNERYLNFFERIRDKYKIIKNLDSKRIYNRRRPFEGL